MEGVVNPPIKDYSEEYLNYIEDTVKNNGLDVLDGRDCFTDKEKQKGLFYRTDHHWQFSTAFRVASETAKHLNEEHDLGLQGVNLSLTKKCILVRSEELFLKKCLKKRI